ncbi:hypothetical protein ACLI4Z_19265 (plasmid) [Natrialbaceae archaeon A-arb3/5]
MSRAETPAGSRLDLEGLASGPRGTVPCGVCNAPTRSHTLVDTGEQWCELEGAAVLEDVDTGAVVTFAVVCHRCFETLPLPAQGEQHERLTGAVDGDGVFEGVVG